AAATRASRIRCSARRCCAGSRSSASRTSRACPPSPLPPPSRGSTTAGSSSDPPASVNAVSVEPQVRHTVEDLLDEESLAVLAILLAVSLEFGFGFRESLRLVGGPPRRADRARNADRALPQPALAADPDP